MKVVLEAADAGRFQRQVFEGPFLNESWSNRHNLSSPMVPWVLLWNLSSCQGPEQSQELTKNQIAITWVYKSSGGPWLGWCEYTNEESNDQSEETVRPAETRKGSQSGMLLHPPTPVSLKVEAEAGKMRKGVEEKPAAFSFSCSFSVTQQPGIFLWVLPARGFQSLTADAGSHRNPVNLSMNVSCFSERGELCQHGTHMG